MQNRQLINFDKCRFVSEKIAATLCYDAFNSTPDFLKFDSLVYLETKLSHTSLSQNAEREQEQRALELQAIEDKDYNRRAPELRAVGGFGVKFRR